MQRDDVSHNQSIGRIVRFGTDNITAKVTPFDYNPVPVIPEGYFLEFQGGGVPFLLLNGTFMTLL